MGKRRADADSRRFFDALPWVRVSRFRADGTIDPTKQIAAIPFPDGTTKLIGVKHTWFARGGGWSFFDKPYKQGLHDKTSGEKSFATGVVPLDQIMARTGLEFLTDMAAGKLPQPPMCATLGFHLAEVSNGYARFDGVPEYRHYNPIGTVHGGFAATLLDSALGCAIFLSACHPICALE